MENGDKEILSFQTQRAFSALCKNFLYILEGLKKEHEINFSKLRASLPYSYQNLLNQAEFLDDARYSYLRKLVLDRGGDSSREILQEIEKYDVRLDYEK